MYSQAIRSRAGAQTPTISQGNMIVGKDREGARTFDEISPSFASPLTICLYCGATLQCGIIHKGQKMSRSWWTAVPGCQLYEPQGQKMGTVLETNAIKTTL